VFLRDGVKAPLALGDVLLSDGAVVKGFVGESYGVVGAPDVSAHGGWRAFLAAQEQEGQK
jgi:allophanate hydrolase